MPIMQLLVRNLDRQTVVRLKERARARGVSTEEEHRHILREAVLREAPRKPTLAEFLLSDENAVLPEVPLELGRSREKERRDTGL